MYPKASLGTNGAAATIVLGQPNLSSNTANNGGVSAASLSGPRGLVFDSSGNLWVTDGVNNRVLMYPKANLVTGGAATIVLGQPDFVSNTANNPSLSATSLDSPFYLSFDSSGNLWVEDFSNNRVLMYPKASLGTNGAAATIVLGQPDLTHNSGGISATSLDFPRGLAFDSSGNLWVADHNNNRVLMYPKASLGTNGAAATVELGQPSGGTAFTTGTANTGGVSATSLNGPLGLTFDSSGNLWVSDYSNSRVLMYPKANLVTGGAATIVLGEPDFTHNSGGTSATLISGSRGIAFDSSGNLWVIDGVNNRVLMYPKANLVTGGAATVELGQPSGTAFTSKTANNGGLSATSLFNPFYLSFDSSGNLWVADHNNNRILMYPKASLGTNGAAATVELGQPSGTAFTSNNADNGGLSATSLYIPFGIAFDPSGNLWVGDQSNNRVLMYPKANLGTNGAAATVELGQPSGTAFISNTANNGGLSATSLDFPHGLAFDSSGNLWVADNSNNRILMYPNLDPSTTTVSTTTISSGTNTYDSGSGAKVSYTATSGFSGTTLAVTKQSTNTQCTSSPPNNLVVGYYDIETNSPDLLTSRTVTLSYTSSEVAGISQSSLHIARCSANSWSTLSSTVDESALTVAASPPGFSLYAIVGTPSGGAGGTTVGYPPSFTTGFAQNEYPLTINSNNYNLPNYTNTGPTSVITLGAPFKISVMLYGDNGPLSVKHVSLVTNIRGNYASITNADTALIWDASAPLQVVDPHHFFGSITANATVVGNKLQVTFYGTFVGQMPVSDIGIRAWGYDAYSHDVYLINALQSTASVGTLGSTVDTPTQTVTINPDTGTQASTASTTSTSTTNQNTPANWSCVMVPSTRYLAIPFITHAGMWLPWYPMDWSICESDIAVGL